MASPASFPVLRIGSFGEYVRLLQRALNVAPSQLPKLNPDAQFGPKTNSRVVEFQRQNSLVQDGVVGPITWGELQPFLDALSKIVDQSVPPAADEQAQRQRIVDVARSALQTFGWASPAVVPDGSPRIAAARGFGPAIAGVRARQGGASLASIYSLAGASPALCLTITTDMETVYQQDAATHPERRGKINQQDIGSWCGIFATYCYRVSGLKIKWDDVKSQSSDMFDRLASNAAVQKGDIGVMDPTGNHHFIVREDCGPGKNVLTIDGNVGNPREQDVSPWNSVIAERFYLRSTLAAKNGTFLRPKFAAMK